MATRHGSAGPPAPITSTNPIQSVTLSCLDSIVVVEDEAILHDDDKEAKERLKREAEQQALFQKVSNDRLGIPNGYRQVQVLLIRWHESIDDFPAHSAEVERLEKIFTKRFNYGCSIAELRNKRNPQLELNHVIDGHVMKHDGDENLLIVYYTGHGAQLRDANGGLQLRLSALENVDKGAIRPATALWRKAEETLRTRTDADVLAILDCCFASTAAVKNSSDQTRAYSLLAASSTEGYTPEPGPKSFTTALCDSLEELLDESEDETFPLIKLWEKINTKPGQGSIPWDRLERHKQTFGNIRLGRLQPDLERETSFHDADPELASLTLRFSLKTDELDDIQIRNFAYVLPETCKEAGIPVRRMEWVGFENRDRYLMQKVANQFRRSLSGSKRKRSPSRVLEWTKPPETRSQTRSGRDDSTTSEDIAGSGLRTPPRRSGRGRHVAGG